MGRRVRAGHEGTSKLALLLLVLGCVVLLPFSASGSSGEAPVGGNAAGWGSIDIGALLSAMDRAYRDSDLAAAAALIDFPLVVMIASSEGQALAVNLGCEEWLESVEPRFNGARAAEGPRTSTVEVITESLAWIDDDRTTFARPAFMKGARGSVVVVRRGGRWLIKAIVARHLPGSASAITLAPALG